MNLDYIKLFCLSALADLKMFIFAPAMLHHASAKPFSKTPLNRGTGGYAFMFTMIFC
jgi:hypothetical protein